MSPKDLLKKTTKEIKNAVDSATFKDPIYLAQLKDAINNNNPLSIAFMGDDVAELYKRLTQ